MRLIDGRIQGGIFGPGVVCPPSVNRWFSAGVDVARRHLVVSLYLAALGNTLSADGISLRL